MDLFVKIFFGTRKTQVLLKEKSCVEMWVRVGERRLEFTYHNCQREYFSQAMVDNDILDEETTHVTHFQGDFPWTQPIFMLTNRITKRFSSVWIVFVMLLDI